jgi:putative membrane protein
MRKVQLILGLLTLAAAWVSPLPVLARQAFFAHMTMHMAVVAVAAPLLALGIAGTRLDPVARAPRLFAPIPVSLIEFAVVWVWHAPAFHHAARGGALAMAGEQATFLFAGLAMWLAALGGGAAAGGPRAAAGIAGLLLTSMHMTLLGALLALTPRPLYAHAHGASIAPLADQQLGGAIMLLAGGCSYLAGALYLTARLLRRRELPA